MSKRAQWATIGFLGFVVALSGSIIAFIFGDLVLASVIFCVVIGLEINMDASIEVAIIDSREKPMAKEENPDKGGAR